MSSESKFLFKTLVIILLIFFGTSWIIHSKNSNTIDNDKIKIQRNLDLIAKKIEFQLFSKMPSLVAKLSNESSIQQFLISSSTQDIEVDTLLYSIRKYHYTESCYILDSNGIVKASNTNDDISINGKNFSFRKYFIRAFKGESSAWAAVGLRSKKRGIYFSSPIKFEQKNIGVAVIKLGLLELDIILRDSKYPLALITNDTIVFASNQNKWLMKSLKTMTDLERIKLMDSQKYGHYQLETLDFIFSDKIAQRNGDSFRYYKSPISLSGWYLIQFHSFF
ncbi:MAG: hypothetical protein COB02_12885 [Candidatus Cloacimonadota bacterium]|nr:MAG: hypothetical protein COB02_12885 [Candidatus Cloacimonadota bacterium]